MKRIAHALTSAILLIGVLAACSGLDADRANRGPSVGFGNLAEDQVVGPTHPLRIMASDDGSVTDLSVRISGRETVELDPSGGTT